MGLIINPISAFYPNKLGRFRVIYFHMATKERKITKEELTEKIGAEKRFKIPVERILKQTRPTGNNV